MYKKKLIQKLQQLIDKLPACVKSGTRYARLNRPKAK